jgi:hypothetical protein
MNANTITADQKVDRLYELIKDARTWLAMDSIDNVKQRLESADTLALELRHGPVLEKSAQEMLGNYHADHDVDEWVEVILGNGMPPIKDCCITAVKFSRGGHIHFDLIYVTHRDDSGTANYQKMYHVPTGLINSLPKDGK